MKVQVAEVKDDFLSCVILSSTRGCRGILYTTTTPPIAHTPVTTFPLSHPPPGNEDDNEWRNHPQSSQSSSSRTPRGPGSRTNSQRKRRHQPDALMTVASPSPSYAPLKGRSVQAPPVNSVERKKTVRPHGHITSKGNLALLCLGSDGRDS